MIEEIAANLGHHDMIIGTGGGSRARHAYSVGRDLGLPTGVLSVLGTFVSMQNARMLNYLLAKYGIPFIEPAQVAQLPHYLAERGLSSPTPITSLATGDGSGRLDGSTRYFDYSEEGSRMRVDKPQALSTCRS